MKRIIKATCLVLSVVLVLGSFVSCSSKVEETAGTTTTAGTTQEETQTTVQRTTENLKTTFPENYTAKVYEGLSKDTNGSYPYEIASYTTYYQASNKSRTANLLASVNKINDIKIPNGRVFSFNQTVGKRTVTAGYESATVIAEGEFVDGLGGGVCQVSSTVFECVLRANVEIVKRTYHSLEISYVPLGGDATVQWNSKDFQFKNNLGCDTKLVMTCRDGKLTCKLMAKKKVDVGKVKISITKDKETDTYTLTRYVDGKANYTTQSKYKKPQPTTTKATTTKKAQ